MSSVDLFGSWASLAELWWTRHGGPTLGAPPHRLHLLVEYAREYSPFYRKHYAGLPARGVPLAALPPVSKPQLMAQFDRWATDRRIRLRELRAFVGDPHRIGERFLEGYWVWTSSGTTGVPGIFVQDAQAMAVYDALVAARLEEAPLRALAAGGRSALVVATGGHFASIASWERRRRAFPSLDARSFSVLEPLPRLVERLNAFQPAVLAGYPSVLAMLAGEREAGRLASAPALIWSGGEHLGLAAREAIERAFGCPVMNEYGTSECLAIAHECRAGWMHLNQEWVALEAVQRDGTPTPPGELSHSTLLTNLANWAQPVIRYDLGDRIVPAGAPCACGSPLPAFRLEGRTEETLALRSPRGAAVRLAPLALTTVVEEAAGARRFQIAKVGPARLALRFERAPGERLGKVRARAALALKSWLALQSLPNVELVQDPAPPRVDPSSGKLRSVVVEDRAPG